MTNKIIGSILLILGTCVGAGMLAIPIVSANQSFLLSGILLFSAWLIMTIGAFALLEVNFWFKPGCNLITMAQSTLGAWGKVITSLVYILLMYSLVCAYLSGASDIVQISLSFADIDISRQIATIVSLLILGSIVYQGVKVVDITNRFLLGIKLIMFIVVVGMLTPHIDLSKLHHRGFNLENDGFIVMVTSFGYAIILPTLRQYLDSDRKVIKSVVLIGSLIPLLIYFIWMFVVESSLEHDGANGLIAMAQSENASSQLMLAISNIIEYQWIKYIASIFVSVYILTAFICVSISLADFIADGLKKVKKGKDNLIIHGLCFIPPLVIVLLSPGIFITALTYAGVWCIVLLIILPLLMLYSGRYKNVLSDHHILPGGRWFILTMLLVAFAFLLNQFLKWS